MWLIPSTPTTRHDIHLIYCLMSITTENALSSTSSFRAIISTQL